MGQAWGRGAALRLASSVQKGGWVHTRAGEIYSRRVYNVLALHPVGNFASAKKVTSVIKMNARVRRQQPLAKWCALFELLQ